MSGESLKYKIGQMVEIEPKKGHPILCRIKAKDKQRKKYQLDWSPHDCLNTIWIPEGSIRNVR